MTEPKAIFGQNPARNRMMVYAGHVPSHFVLEISRGIQRHIQHIQHQNRQLQEIQLLYLWPYRGSVSS